MYNFSLRCRCQSPNIYREKTLASTYSTCEFRNKRKRKLCCDLCTPRILYQANSPTPSIEDPIGVLCEAATQNYCNQIVDTLS